MMITRRAALIGSASAALACGHAHGAPKAMRRRNNSQQIDCHFHVMPPEYRKLVGDARADRRMDTWTVQGSLEAMDAVGAQMAIASITTPGLWFDDVGESRAMCRVSNDFMKRLEIDYPGRFRTFGAIALPDVEGSLQEIDYCYNRLGVVGIGVFTSYKVGNEIRWLGHKSFEPVMEELNAREAIVRTHPDAPCCAGFLLPHGIVDANLEYGVDTARAMLNVIFSGWLTKYPKIKWIWGHGGGVIPYYIDRMNRLPQTIKPLAQYAPNGFLVEFNKMYYDTAQIAHATPLDALSDITPIDNILFGSDYPYRTLTDHVTALELMFTPPQLQRINRGNILRLMDHK